VLEALAPARPRAGRGREGQPPSLGPGLAASQRRGRRGTARLPAGDGAPSAGGPPPALDPDPHRPAGGGHRERGRSYPPRAAGRLARRTAAAPAGGVQQGQGATPGEAAGGAVCRFPGGHACNGWRIPDALRRITDLLEHHPRGLSLASCLPPISPRASDRPVRLRAALASTLVAGLELACDGAVLVIQDEPFGSVNFEAALA
jgi:hypothetical protein